MTGVLSCEDKESDEQWSEGEESRLFVEGVEWSPSESKMEQGQCREKGPELTRTMEVESRK